MNYGLLRDIRYVEFKRASRGWCCEIEGRVPTQRQFSHETHRIRGNGQPYWMGLMGVISALVAALVEWKVVRAELAAITGDFALDE
jgi:hypothetical protein